MEINLKIKIDDRLVGAFKRILKKRNLIGFIAVCALSLGGLAWASGVSLNTFTGGEVISASAVNQNFSNINAAVSALTDNNNSSQGALDSPLSGTVSVSSGAAEVSGSGTAFTTELEVGDAIKIGTENFTVSAIASDTSLTINSTHSAGASDVTVYKDSNLFVVKNGAGVDKISVDKSGKLAVGTISPGAALDVEGSIHVDESISVGDSIALLGDSPSSIESSQNHLYIKSKKSMFLEIDSQHENTGEKVIQFKTDPNTPTMTIKENGNVGIGTTTINYTLHVNGDAGKNGGGSWSDSSDRRLKKNINNLDSKTALKKLTSLQGVSFDWIHPEDHQSARVAGLVAQEVEEVFPEWVKEADPSAADKKLLPEGEKAKSLSFPHGFNAYLIEALKELQAMNEDLRRENTELRRELKQEIAELKKMTLK